MLPEAIKCNISIFEFWDLTIGEIYLIINSKRELEESKIKETVVTNYNLATMISSFISLALKGKQPPSLKEMFPSLFQSEEIEEDTPTVDYSVLRIKEQLLDFANARNKRLKVKEGENK